MDRIRVLRLVEYVGPRDQVEKQIALSLHGTRFGMGRPNDQAVMITAVTLGVIPEVLDPNRPLEPFVVAVPEDKHGA